MTLRVFRVIECFLDHFYENFFNLISWGGLGLNEGGWKNLVASHIGWRRIEKRVYIRNMWDEAQLRHETKWTGCEPASRRFEPQESPRAMNCRDANPGTGGLCVNGQYCHCAMGWDVCGALIAQDRSSLADYVTVIHLVLMRLTERGLRFRGVILFSTCRLLWPSIYLVLMRLTKGFYDLVILSQFLFSLN